MTEMKQNEQIVKISNWLAPKIDKYELILAFVFLVVLSLHISTELPMGVFMILDLTTLAAIFYIRAYSIPDDPNAGVTERVIDKIASMSLSVCIIGILFRLESWPGYDTMLSIGLITLGIAFLSIFFFKFKNPELKIYTPRLKLRIFIVLALGLFLYFTPTNDLINFGILKNNNIESTK